MKNYDALFEDENDIFGGTPQSKYWDISNQISTDFAQEAFDDIITRMASMEQMLMKYYDEEELDDTVKYYGYDNSTLIEERKKSLYMELAGRLIYKLTD
jgi:hypothetical protein